MKMIKIALAACVAVMVAHSAFAATPVKTKQPLPDNLSAPEIVKQVMPEYPIVMRQNGMPGYVKVEFLLDEQGDMHGAAVIESTDERFDKTVLAALEKWQFTPATKEGKTTPIVMRVPFRFILVDEPGNDVVIGDLERIAGKY